VVGGGQPGRRQGTQASLLARSHGDGVARGLAHYAVTVTQTPFDRRRR
jgi:hypothetical protein